MKVPFGAKVLYWNNPKQNVTGESKFSATGVDGVFLGYHIQPSFNWRKEYLVAPLKGVKQALEAGNLQVLRSKRMELPPGKFVFQLLDDEAHQPPPRLDDQDCYRHDGDLFNDYSRSSHDEAGQGGSDEPEGGIRIGGMTMRELFGDDDEEEELIPARPGPRPPEAVDPTMHGEPSSSLRGPTVPHDPTRMPDGEPVPPGFNWDGVRLARNRRGSRRPTDTPAELWPRMSANQRREDIARFEVLQRQAEERRTRESEDAAPAMPVTYNLQPEHRERLKSLKASSSTVQKPFRRNLSHACPTCQCDDYDMRDFLVSCVDKYCELAKVSKSTLKHMSTPFHENRIAKPTSDNEPQGHLQPIASKVLMKIEWPDGTCCEPRSR